ncbi:hypothetical protein LOAG_00588 [Loa loa]|nr:hypothetical protein LOAG_00588 [Loa loa]EFO27887.1 hypothetical protein LOAG_00588 [Loa loa]
MPKRGRQVELINGTKHKIRDVGLSKPARAGYSHAARRGVSPEIQSVQGGRIRLGSVAPLLSRRAKALAMKDHYNHYSDDEVYDSDNSDEDSFSEDDYDEELYDYNRHHRSYDRRRTPFHFMTACEDYEDELTPSPSFPISTSQLFDTRRLPKSYQTRKSAVVTSVPPATKSLSTAKVKKNTAGFNPKDRNKK